MPMVRLSGETCWGEAWHPVILPRNPAHYDTLADVLDAVSPPDWMKVTASIVISGKGRRSCSVGPRCGATSAADDECIHAVHDAIMALGARCIAPRGMRWVGIWVEHDFAEGAMVVRMMHGGPAHAPSGRIALPPGIMAPESSKPHDALAA